MPSSPKAGQSPPTLQTCNEALVAGWEEFDIAQMFSLDEIVQAHEFVEHPTKHGRVVVTI